MATQPPAKRNPELRSDFPKDILKLLQEYPDTGMCQESSLFGAATPYFDYNVNKAMNALAGQGKHPHRESPPSDRGSDIETPSATIYILYFIYII
jgi:hypothetical protein